MLVPAEHLVKKVVAAETLTAVELKTGLLINELLQGTALHSRTRREKHNLSWLNSAQLHAT